MHLVVGEMKAPKCERAGRNIWSYGRGESIRVRLHAGWVLHRSETVAGWNVSVAASDGFSQSLGLRWAATQTSGSNIPHQPRTRLTDIEIIYRDSTSHRLPPAFMYRLLLALVARSPLDVNLRLLGNRLGSTVPTRGGACDQE